MEDTEDGMTETEGKDPVDPTDTDDSGKVTVEVEESDAASSGLLPILISVIVAVVVALLVVLGIRYWKKKKGN